MHHRSTYKPAFEERRTRNGITSTEAPRIRHGSDRFPNAGL